MNGATWAVASGLRTPGGMVVSQGCEGKGSAWRRAGMPGVGGCSVVGKALEGVGSGSWCCGEGCVRDSWHGSPETGVVGVMVEAPCPVAGGCGIVNLKDFRPALQIVEIPSLCDDEVLMWGGKVVCESRGNDDLYVSQGPKSLGQTISDAMEHPVKHEASRQVLGAFGRACCDGEIGKAVVEEINRRLGGLSISVGRKLGCLRR
jgi:hypothetical protein